LIFPELSAHVSQMGLLGFQGKAGSLVKSVSEGHIFVNRNMELGSTVFHELGGTEMLSISPRAATALPKRIFHSHAQYQALEPFGDARIFEVTLLSFYDPGEWGVHFPAPWRGIGAVRSVNPTPRRFAGHLLLLQE
jgi:hypothetical protein